jgi:hypothetical protein
MLSEVPDTQPVREESDVDVASENGDGAGVSLFYPGASFFLNSKLQSRKGLSKVRNTLGNRSVSELCSYQVLTWGPVRI